MNFMNLVKEAQVQVSLPITRNKIHSFHQLTSAGGCIPAGSARPRGSDPRIVQRRTLVSCTTFLAKRTLCVASFSELVFSTALAEGFWTLMEDVKAGGLSPGPPGHQSGLTGPKSSSACPGYKSLVARNLHLATSVCGPPGHRFGARVGRQRKDDALAFNDAI